MAEKIPNRRSGLHFRLNDPADLARAMSEAADEVMYQALCSGLPDVADHATMARDYMATFSRLVKFPGAAATADEPRATSPRRRRVAAVS